MPFSSVQLDEFCNAHTHIADISITASFPPTPHTTSNRSSDFFLYLVLSFLELPTDGIKPCVWFCACPLSFNTVFLRLFKATISILYKFLVNLRFHSAEINTSERSGWILRWAETQLPSLKNQKPNNSPLSEERYHFTLPPPREERSGTPTSSLLSLCQSYLF